MSELGTYVSAVRMQSRSAFMARYKLPFLLVKQEELAATAAQEDDWAGTTRMTRALGKAGSFAVLRHNAAIYRVHELACQDVANIGQGLPESASTAIRYTVHVGRTPDNDVSLQMNAISKRHARFTCNVKNEWFATDLGSRNGTTVNGRRLVPEQPVPVNFGDPITMGDVALMIIGAGALYEIVAKQLADHKDSG